MKNTDKQLTSSSGRYHIAANGEIYNYRELEERWLKEDLCFQSNGGTDIEILVNMHEVLSTRDVPELLDGMFSYSLLDDKMRALNICRDPQGEKPLYIYDGPNLVVISSEIRPILLLVPSIRLDPQVLRDYFNTRHLYEATDEEYNSYLDKNVRGKVESDLDGMALTKSRQLLTGRGNLN